MEPLRVELTLQTPMIEPAFPIHLDALLAWAAVEEATELSRRDPLTAQEELPLQRVGEVWAASALQFTQVATPTTTFTTKRTDVGLIADSLNTGAVTRAANKLSLNSGPFRQALTFHQTRQPESAVAWCVGERSDIERLLDRISYLGARRRLGHGEIGSRIVSTDKSAHTRWKERIMPEPADGYFPVRAVLSPPYWDRTREKNAWVHGNVV